MRNYIAKASSEEDFQAVIEKLLGNHQIQEKCY